MPELMASPPPVLPPAQDARAQILARVFATFDRAGIPWCVVHGYQAWPNGIRSDVDLLIPPEVLPGKLARLLYDNGNSIGAQIVFWLEDRAQYIVLADPAAEHPCVIQLHVSPDYSLAGRVFYSASEVLDARCRRDGFWSPAPAIEFGCVLVNRIVKQELRPEHRERLAELASLDPDGCRAQLARFFSSPSARLLWEAASEHEWEPVDRKVSRLRHELLGSPAATRAGGTARSWVRRIRRWLWMPAGLHIVFLGPDGVGKSTVIDAVRRDLAAAIFLRVKYLTFAPSLMPGRFEPAKPGGPHSLPPRSLPASLLKAAWWALCYTFGYYIGIHPTRARGGLVINHRYLPDAIVDPRRYRYAGPRGLLEALWRVAPKPDLLFLLDAPADVIQARKREVAPQETRRQRVAYRAITDALPFAHVIDTSGRPGQAAAQVKGIILRYLASRAARRLKLGDAP